MATKTLYTQLQQNLALLKHRKMMIPRYVNQPDKFLGKGGYSMDMIPPLEKQIEETEAAIRGIEQWRKERRLQKKAGKEAAGL